MPAQRAARPYTHTQKLKLHNRKQLRGVMLAELSKRPKTYVDEIRKSERLAERARCKEKMAAKAPAKRKPAMLVRTDLDELAPRRKRKAAEKAKPAAKPAAKKAAPKKSVQKRTPKRSAVKPATRLIPLQRHPPVTTGHRIIPSAPVRRPRVRLTTPATTGGFAEQERAIDRQYQQAITLMRQAWERYELSDAEAQRGYERLEAERDKLRLAVAHRRERARKRMTG